MPTMKVTPVAAMRARDVSRPHAEHVAWAEAAEAGASAGTPEGVAVETGVTADTEVVVEAAVTEGQGRAEARGRGDGAPRRRRVRSSSRRGRPSR
jgi:hypothetical protein